MKSQTSFVCQECGYDSPAFLGKCPECGMWNTLKEFKTSSNLKSQITNHKNQTDVKPHTLSQIIHTEKDRFETGFTEMDSVLGGGIVPGSVVLLAGDPGIGKSTLLLQMALNISSGRGAEVDTKIFSLSAQGSKKSNLKSKRSNESSENFVSPRANNLQSSIVNHQSVLYISGEESEQQIKLRAVRLTKNLKNEFLFLVSLINTEEIVNLIAETKPALVVIDSIQTMESENFSGFPAVSGKSGLPRHSLLKLPKL